VSDHIDQLRQLAANPLDALRRKECQLHITATYLPLTEQELAVLEREAGRQQSGGGLAAMQRVSTLAATSPRIANLLHRCGVAAFDWTGSSECVIFSQFAGRASNCLLFLPSRFGCSPCLPNLPGVVLQSSAAACSMCF
jgi:hypothetical protein